MQQILGKNSIHDYYKYFDFLFQCKNRNITEYDNIYALDYFDNNDIVKLLMGPYSGLESKKVSLSGILKNTYSLLDTNVTDYPPKLIKNNIIITKMPTSDAIFVRWEEYLESKGVHIVKNSSLDDMEIQDNKIVHIEINNHKVYADEFIFACSLGALNAIIQNKKEFSNSWKMNMQYLENNNLQLYFTVNLYFSIQLKRCECETLTLIDAPWNPIIQRKVNWSEKTMKHCSINNQPIREVWNVGLLDFFTGMNHKILSECSMQEAIQEGILQIKTNEYIQTIFRDNDTTFEESYMGYEVFNQFVNVNNRLVDLNPKYSVNLGTVERTHETKPDNIPDNMYLSGYYVNNSYGGASMESSCITGINASKMVMEKYKLSTPVAEVLPIQHKNEFLIYYMFILWPFIYLDKLLFYFHCPPITQYINSFYLFIVYCILLLFLVCVTIHSMCMFFTHKKGVLKKIKNKK